MLVASQQESQGLFTQPFAVSYQNVGDYLLTRLSLDPHTVITYLFRKDYDAICVKGTFICPFLPDLHAFVSFSCLTELGRAFIMVLKKKEKTVKLLRFSPLIVMPVAKFSVTVS